MEGGLLQWVGEKNLSVYRDDFEARFLDSTDKYYVQKAASGVSTQNCPEYLNLVDRCLRLEEDNADTWLEPESKSRCLDLVVRNCVTRQAEVVADKETGCEFMFEHSKLEELKLCNKIFKRDENTEGNSQRHIINKMNPYIVRRGEKIVNDEALL